MGLSCGDRCMKYLLFGFNFIFWLAGAGILGVGIWMKVDPNINRYLEIISVDTSNPFINAAIWTIIAVGSFIFLVGFLGCCGACQESGWMLMIYAILIVLVILLQITAAILAGVFRGQLGDVLKTSMGKQANRYVSTDYQDTITLAWTHMQYNLKCCGGNNFLDYRDSRFVNESGANVPPTCCKMSELNIDNPIPDDYDACKTEAASSNPSNAQNLHTEGCYDGIVDWLNRHSGILIGVACGIAALEILGVILACCVRSAIKNGEKYA